ncbi:MAG: ATP-binding protein [Sporichthyaceae bacterium]
MTNARSTEVTFDCDLSGVRAARHFVRDALLRWELPTVVDDASLGVSELVANAVRHAGTEFAVRVDVSDKVVVTVVDGRDDIDESATATPPKQPSRGLTIVSTIAEEWGVTALADGKAVWFSLPLPDASSADADLHHLSDHRATSGRSAPMPAAAYEVRSAV